MAGWFNPETLVIDGMKAAIDYFEIPERTGRGVTPRMSRIEITTPGHARRIAAALRDQASFGLTDKDVEMVVRQGKAEGQSRSGRLLGVMHTTEGEITINGKMRMKDGPFVGDAVAVGVEDGADAMEVYRMRVELAPNEPEPGFG